MVITTNLNIPPYNQTYDASDGYTEILFKPGVSPQITELNNLQPQFQNQIESFGDNIFSGGTIVSGCTFRQFNPYPYIKINDLTSSGIVAFPSQYQYQHIFNSNTGLIGFIIDYQNGYQSTDPNLKTLYITYLNTGYHSNVTTFSAGDTLEIYNALQNGIEKIIINNGANNFSNSDYVVATSAIAVNVATGSFANLSYVVNSSGANLQIISVDTTTLANVNQVILSLSPRSIDLANSLATSSNWTFANNTTIRDTGNTVTGIITQVIGSKFAANVITDGSGSIIDVLINDKGIGYTYLPTISMRSITGNYNYLSLTAQNYVDKIIVASTSNAVGNGYAFGISDGIIYQKGFLLKVSAQSIIVSKYNQLPDNVSVYFTTSENIITPNIDPSLNDPDTGPNNGAPGANRMMLTPTLILGAPPLPASTQTDVTPLVTYNAGNPYFIQPQTIYSKIGDTMAQRTMEQSANFYVDPFLVTVSSPANNTGNNFTINVDPGSGYVNGYRVQTVTNYIMNDYKALQTTIQNNTPVPLNYQNYITIDNVGGTFAFNTGDVISFYDTAKGFLSNTALIKAQNTNPVGNLLGTARMRSMVLANTSQYPGMNTAQYNLYLFDIQMNSGKNFSDIESIYYNGAINKGIADVVQIYISTSNSYQTIIQGNTSDLVFSIYAPGMTKNVNNVIYTYKTVDQTLNVNSSGVITKNIASYSFAYTANLNNTQLLDLYVVPTVNNLVTANLSGTISCNTTSPIINGTSTSFTNSLNAGDYIFVYSGTTAGAYDIHFISQIVNNTQLIVESNVSFSNTSTTIARVFPKNVPIPLGSRRGLSANVNVSGNTLTINLGTNLTVTSNVTVACSITSNATQLTKTPNRGGYVMLRLANNVASTVGPWCLGVPDIFRLRGVWIGNSSVSNTGSNYIQSFYIDNNQNDDFYDLGYLYLQKSANVNLNSSNYILVEFDYFTSSGTVGYYDVSSYLTSNTANVIATDILPLSNLVSTSLINTFEVPQYFSVDNGIDVDLINCFDFRRQNSNTIGPSTNPVIAPINPAYTLTFTTTEQMFPLPGSNLYCTTESYLPRFDSVYIDQNGIISYTTGISTSTKVIPPATPASTMKIADIFIPGYPCIPIQSSQTLNDIINVGVINQHYPYSRIGNQLIKILPISNEQAPVYTDADIANIDTRLKQVENYVSLNQLESNVANMSIPSSIDPSLNRYKFGYFVDNFTTSLFMDTLDPQFKSIKENGDMVPTKLNWELWMPSIALPHIPVLIISQENATIGTVSDPTFQPNCAINIANNVAYQMLFRNINDCADLLGSQPGTVDVVNLTLADADHMANALISNTAVIDYEADYWSSSPTDTTVELFFYAYDCPTLFQIYQGNTLIIDSSSAIPLTENDINNLTGARCNYWFNDQTSTYMQNPVDTGGGYVMYAGKLQWNYTGSGGQNITIRTTNGPYAQFWKWVLSYPINGIAAGCAPPYDIEQLNSAWYGCVNQICYNAAATLNDLNSKAEALGIQINGTVTWSGSDVYSGLNDVGSYSGDLPDIASAIIRHGQSGALPYYIGSTDISITANGSQSNITTLNDWIQASGLNISIG